MCGRQTKTGDKSIVFVNPSTTSSNGVQILGTEETFALAQVSFARFLPARSIGLGIAYFQQVLLLFRFSQRNNAD